MAREGHLLDRFLDPKSVALFGSMQENWFFGPGVIIGDLLKWGYKGTLYPVHPTAESVYGIKVLRDLREAGAVPELAVVATSYKHVPGILRQCGEKGVKAAVVVSDGFGEAGEEGKAREAEILGIARSCGIRIMGPNTIGVFDSEHWFTTIPYNRGYDYSTRSGLSIVTQTGMYGPQAMAWNEYEAGINKMIDLGNMCDVDETDCLDYLAEDDSTGIVSIYMEHSRRPRAFLEAVQRVARKKPVLCLMPGGSPGAAAAMASHTGSMAGNASLYAGLFRQAGVLRVEEYEDLRDCATPFLRFPLPKGNRIGILTYSGGIGIQCIDAAEAYGLRVGRLSPESRRRLSAISPTMGSHPVDVGPASATAGTEIFNLYRSCFDVLREDDNIDCIYLNTYVSHSLRPEYYGELLQYIGSCREKPIVSWCYGPARQLVVDFGVLAERAGTPFYLTSRKAVRSLACMARYAAWRAETERTGHE